MISRELFDSVIEKILLLTGQDTTEQQMNALYDAVKECDSEDFLEVGKDRELLESWSRRISYPALQDAIERSRMRRIEKEQKEQKRIERKESEKFFKNNKKSTRCKFSTPGHCYRCPTVYCDVVAQEAIKGIKDILSKKRTAKEVNTELARQFKGIGFENETPDLQPF